MNRWLLFCVSAVYAGTSMQAAFAAGPPSSGPAPSMAASKPLHHPSNFDASLVSPQEHSRQKSSHKRLPKPGSRAGGLQYQSAHSAPLIYNHYDKTLNKPTFIWPGKNDDHDRALDFKVYRKGAGASTYAKAYLRQYASNLDIKPVTVNHARLVFVHDDDDGPVIARFQEVVNGYDVVNRQLNVIMNQDLSLVAISGYFANQKSAPTRKAFGVGPQAAMNAAFADLHLPVSASNLRPAHQRNDGFALYAPPARTRRGVRAAAIQLTAPVGAKKVLFPSNGKLVAGWLLTVQAGRAGGADSVGYAYVASVDGQVLYRKNLIDHAAYDYRVFANKTTKKPKDSPLGNDRVPWPGYSFPEDPGTGQLVTVTSTHGLMDPWLPLPVAGAPTNRTQGNNVWAYLDVAGGDGKDAPEDIWATTTAPNTFDYPFDFNIEPTDHTNQEQVIVNLFYIDNWLHDTWYDAGFTEALGNAQYDNYGRGGVPGDPIHAEAQDFSGLNNANMYTPPDGGSPRQQMYLWTGPILSQITKAVSTSGQMFVFDPALVAVYGPQEFDITAPLAIYNDGDPSGTGIHGELDACQPTTQDLSGKIALIADIYTCNFTVKTKNAQNAGAVAAVVVYNGAANPDQAFKMGGTDSTITIPSLGVSDDDADPAIADIRAGNTVTLHMAVDQGPKREGSLDAQIVSHEFFHYVSNRLVGNATGLANTQGGGMGEGWSDMAALLLTARADDLATNPDGYYTEAGYVTDDFRHGLRTYPYTTDMAINPLTFGDITTNPEVHFVGTVWATMLWDAYVGLYKHYAAEDPTTAYATAKSKMMNYILEGLMGTPNAPTMVEARDAILAAAYATSKVDYHVFVKAFAKRGIGFGAIAPPRESDTLAGVTESYKTKLKAFIIQNVGLNVNGPAVCDADYSLDPGETGELKLTLLNTGSAALTGITARLSSRSDITFPNGGKVTFEPDTLAMFGGTVSATVPVTVNSADRTGETMAIMVRFPDIGGSRGAVQESHPIQLRFTSNQDLQDGEFIDDMEHQFASLYDWTRRLTGHGPGWSIGLRYSASLGLPRSNHYWYGPDNGSPSELSLVTPPIHVGSDAFSVSFYHYYQFEEGGREANGGFFGYDGGVVEISTDGGATWRDVTKAGGTFKYGYSGVIGPYNIYIKPGRSAFVNTGGTLYDGSPEVISFGEALAGDTIQLRFRIGNDPASGDLGWVIDNVTAHGATDPMFSVVVPETSYCNLGGFPPPRGHKR